MTKSLEKKIKWSPHKAQREILKYRKRFTAICAGTRFGKSQLCAYIALQRLRKPNQHIWIVGPTYGLSTKVFEHLRNFINEAFPNDLKQGHIKISDREGKYWIKIPYLNSWVECKSAEHPNSLLGEELDLIIMDECSRIKKNVWESYVYQRLASRQGDVIFISTPFGKNWFYHMYKKCAVDGAAFNYSSKANPTFKKSEWEMFKRTMSEDSFKQELRAKFLDDAAQVFRGIRGIISDHALADVKNGHTYVMGVDLAKHGDFSVVTIIDKYNNNVVYWDRFRKIDYPFQKKRIIATTKRYNNARIIVDSTGVGQPIKDDLEREGLLVDDFNFSGKSKKELIEKLSIYIEQKLIYIPNKEELIDELEAFGYQMINPKTGESLKEVRYSAPAGMHDDCVDSLALAVWGLQGRARPKTAIQEQLEKVRKPKMSSYI